MGGSNLRETSCQRLSISCAPSAGVRKRRAKALAESTPANSRLEEKLDSIVNLLRSGAIVQAGHPTPPSLSSDGTHSHINSPLEPANVTLSSDNNCPDMSIAGGEGTIQLLPSSNTADPTSLIFNDVSIHTIADLMAEGQLSTFRQFFLPMFPVIHLPPNLSAAELRQRKPFCWLVIMALASKEASRQFSMEGTIWHIISNRVTCQHLATMDLLLGIICFAAWLVHD